MENISTIYSPNVDFDFENINEALKSIGRFQISIADSIAQFRRTFETIQPSIANVSKQIGEIVASVRPSFVMAISIINEIKIPTIIFPSDLLGWQSMSDNVVQSSNQPIQSPLFVFDSNFYEERFDDFKRKSDKHSNADQFKIFTHYLLLLLTFLKQKIVDEFMSYLLWAPIVGFLWQGSTHLFYWLMKLLN